MMTILLGAALGVGAVSTSGCTGSIRGQASYTTTTARPRLVLVSPGVYVVEDYDQSVFYSEGYYWRTSGDRWYRSRTYDDGYVAVRFESIPVRVRRIERPHAYVHFRAGADARVYSRRAHSVRDYRESRRDRDRDRGHVHRH